MPPHAVASSSLHATSSQELEEGRPRTHNLAGIHGFREAFSKARRLDEPRNEPGPQARRTRPDHDDGTSARRAECPAASTRRRDEPPKRQGIGAGEAARPEPQEGAERDAGEPRAAVHRTRARGEVSGTPDVEAPASHGRPELEVTAGATSDAAIAESSDTLGAPPALDTSALFAFLQPAIATPLEAPRGALGFAFEGSGEPGASYETSGRDAATKLAGALGATFADTDHTSETTLHHVSDAFARADHLAARGHDAPRTDATAGAMSIEGMQLSSDARTLLEGQAAGPAAPQTSQTSLPPHDAQAASLTKPVDTATGGRDDAGAETGVSAATIAGAAKASGDAASARDSGGGDVGARSNRDEGARDLARDTLTRTLDTADATTDVRANGAFGAHQRLQSATNDATPETRAEQAKAASERILQQIERIAEQRSAGRDIVIATERGPVRVRVEIAEKQVSVAFRTEDEQLKALLRSGLPALQSTLAKRGFAGSDFRFDGDGSNDMMASGGRGKYADARAVRESRLGEVMVEPVIAETADEARREPKALLSVMA